MRKTKRIVIVKGGYRNKGFTVYHREWMNGKLSYEVVVGHKNRKIDAKKLRDQYKAGKTPNKMGSYYT